MPDIRWKCPNAGCDREIIMSLDDEPKQNGQRITGEKLEYVKREVERSLERQAARHLEMCSPRKSILQGTWDKPIPPGVRRKGPDED